MTTPSPDREAWLRDVHWRAEELLPSPGFAERMDPYLRQDQRGKWGFDSISGYYWYLYALVAVTEPRTVLELGCCLGTSALFTLGALPQDDAYERRGRCFGARS
jgi:hypothetical protein